MEQAVWRRMDTGASARLRRLGKDGGRRPFAVLAHTADAAILFPAAGLIWLVGKEPWKAGAGKAGLSLIVGTVVIGFLKTVFKRRRPEGPWGAFGKLFDPHSFPSGHAGRAAVLAALAVMHLPLWAAAAVVLWALSVGLSRIILGMHYVSDVLAGWLTGIAAAAFVLFSRI